MIEGYDLLLIGEDAVETCTELALRDLTCLRVWDATVLTTELNDLQERAL